MIVECVEVVYLIYQLTTKQQKMKNLTIELIASKTGKVQMGGYYSQKTAEIKIQKADWFDNIYRVGYTSDSVDECFKTFEMAFDRYSKICSIIN